eukprot:9496618-Pyramimonas_sp.AAC.1
MIASPSTSSSDTVGSGRGGGVLGMMAAVFSQDSAVSAASATASPLPSALPLPLPALPLPLPLPLPASGWGGGDW